MVDYKTAILIGRFQPFHNAHFEIAQQGLEISENLVIVVGSCNAAPTIKNPFSFEERRDMILSCLSHDPGGDISKRVRVVGVRDYFCSDNAWVADIQQKTSEFIENNESTTLLGSYKDDSSYYIKLFPQWGFVPAKATQGINATDVREDIFEGGRTWRHDVPPTIAKYIDERLVGTPRWEILSNEYAQIKQYKELWSTAPFPPTFVTVDAVVIKSGHVLVVKRKFAPGAGLLALPGGFLKVSERIEDGMLRELREETGIKVHKTALRAAIKESRVFDYPGRSLRGRTITHAFYIKLDDSFELPEVKGSDDAAKAFWLPLMDVGKRENEFFEDHAQIIWAFMNK
jgi:bifunctional NMN adenylyltransferase/nudix hydrolase